MEQVHIFYGLGPQGNEMFLGELFIALDKYLTGVFVNHIPPDHSTHQILIRKRNFSNFRVFELLDELGSQLSSFFGQNFATFRVFNIHRRTRSCQKLVFQQLGHPILSEINAFGLVKIIEQFSSTVAQSLEQDGDRKLASSINAHVEDVFGVKFQINPRAA